MKPHNVQTQMYFINIMQLKLCRKKGTVCHANIPIGRWHGNKWRVFHICIFQLSNLYSICPSGQQFVTSHNLSSGTEWLLLIDWKNVHCFILKTKCFGLDKEKQVGQMLYLPSSSFSSFNVSLKMAHLLKSPNNLTAEFFLFVAKLLFPSTDWNTEALKAAESQVKNLFLILSVWILID